MSCLYMKQDMDSGYYILHVNFPLCHQHLLNNMFSSLKFLCIFVETQMTNTKLYWVVCLPILFFFYKIVLNILDTLFFYMNFITSVVISINCVKSTDWFGENWHIKNIEFSTPWAQYIVYLSIYLGLHWFSPQWFVLFNIQILQTF